MPWQTVIIFGCSHFPIQDKGYEKWLLEEIEERNPDRIIISGDLLDAKCVSRFEKSGSASLMQEYEAVDSFLETLGDMRKDKNKLNHVFLPGNHEHRIFREEMRHVSDVLDYRKHIKNFQWWDTSREYIYNPKHTYTLGQLTVLHGFGLSKAAIARESLNLGVPGGLVVFSHIHKGFDPAPVMWGQNELPFHIANTGCGIRSDEAYFQQFDTSKWNRGYVFVDVETTKRCLSKPAWKAEFVKHSDFWGTHDR